VTRVKQIIIEEVNTRSGLTLSSFTPFTLRPTGHVTSVKSGHIKPYKSDL